MEGKYGKDKFSRGGYEEEKPQTTVCEQYRRKSSDEALSALVGQYVLCRDEYWAADNIMAELRAKRLILRPMGVKRLIQVGAIRGVKKFKIGRIS